MRAHRGGVMQTISRELAQALKAAGVEGKSYFVWFDLSDEPRRQPRHMSGWPDNTSAYTSDELLALLGETFDSLSYMCGDYRAIGGNGKYFVEEESPVEALGRLLLALRKEVSSHA